MDKRAHRLALLAAGADPLGTGSLCADCDTPRSPLNTGVCWSDAYCCTGYRVLVHVCRVGPPKVQRESVCECCILFTSAE